MHLLSLHSRSCVLLVPRQTLLRGAAGPDRTHKRHAVFCISSRCCTLGILSENSPEGQVVFPFYRYEGHRSSERFGNVPDSNSQE